MICKRDILNVFAYLITILRLLRGLTVTSAAATAPASLAKMLFAPSRSLRKWTSVRGFMSALSLFCLSNVGLMLIQNKLHGLSSAETLVLDLRREGYTEQDVARLLE